MLLTDTKIRNAKPQVKPYKLSIGEIAQKHGYNLNISRYISTAEPEEEIILESVNAKLVALEQKIRTATNQHNNFLRELNLPPLPTTFHD